MSSEGLTQLPKQNSIYPFKDVFPSLSMLTCMQFKESIWIKTKIRTIRNIKTVLDIGSSSFQYREKRPFIKENIFNPLHKRGIRVTLSDKEPVDGIDLICDITSNDLQVQNKYDLIICTNVLEHFERHKLPIARGHLASLLSKEGYLVITVPHVFPFHRDNMWRPNVDELEEFFREKFQFLYGDEISGRFRTLGRTMRLYIGSILYIALLSEPLSRKILIIWKNIKSHLFRNPVISCAVFRKKVICNAMPTATIQLETQV